MNTEIKTADDEVYFVNFPCLFVTMLAMRVVLLLLIVVASLTAGAVNPLDGLRVYAIEPASFDYVFTAVVSGAQTNPVLSFNHRSGRTSFIHPGDPLGEYKVSNYHPVVKRVFNSRINSFQDLKCDRVSLCGTAGPPVVLELGKRMPQPGWMAYLVNLTDGNWWYVRESDAVVLDAVSIHVGPVASNSVILYTVDITNAAALISDNEIRNLTLMWSANGRSRREGRSVDEAGQAQEEPLFEPISQVSPAQTVSRQPDRTVVLRYPSRTFFGTDYSCPTEYMVLPAIWNANGQIVRPTMIVPRRFETRSAGIAIESR